MMRNKIQLGRVAGIGIYAHWTLLVLLIGVFAWFLWKSHSVSIVLAGLLLTSALFGCVVLHELGHALMARRFGIRTLDITIYPIGGVARLEAMPKQPRQEFLIAIAGPAVNLAIAVALFIALLGAGRSIAPDAFIHGEPNVLGSLMWMNVALVVFNMLPAFPMDGGRVLRASLASRMSYRSATRIASYIGQGMAGLFAVAAIFPVPLFPEFNPILLFIALFVFTAARQEATYVLHATKVA